MFQSYPEGFLLKQYLVDLNPSATKFGISKFLGDVSADSLEDCPKLALK